MLIKICGLTRVEDAQAAAQSGATALGFVFWPGSPRYVAPAQVARIVALLPPGTLTVGVFVNETPAAVREAARAAGVGAVQLHGEERPEDWVHAGLRILKAVGAGSASTAEAWPPETLLVLDAVESAARGGTGRRVDWGAAGAMARRREVVLAGGLTPDNVFEAITIVRPYGVDVSSGVELSPGVKAHGLVRRFVAEAQRGFAAAGDWSKEREGD